MKHVAKPRSAKKIAEYLDCYRMKFPFSSEQCQNTNCPYNNNDPEHGNWCCANVLLYDAVKKLRYQDEKIKKLKKMIEKIWTGS